MEEARAPLRPLLVALSAVAVASVAGCGFSEGCGEIHSFSADVTPAQIARAARGGAPNVLDASECWELCRDHASIDEFLLKGFEPDSAAQDSGHIQPQACRVEAEARDRFSVHCQIDNYGPCLGRGDARVEGPVVDPTPDPVPEWLARAAHAEAGSVVAFEALAEELASKGLPLSLQRRLLEAASDERRHAAVMGHLARARGANVPPVVVRAPTSRSLLEIALENAREGCVRETWAALEAHFQAKAAPTAALRAALGRIAVDEARHAELAWALHDWFMGTLSPPQRLLVVRTVESERERLAVDLARASPASHERQLGLPGVAARTWMWGQLCASRRPRVVA